MPINKLATPKCCKHHISFIFISVIKFSYRCQFQNWQHLKRTGNANRQRLHRTDIGLLDAKMAPKS
nr:MAG TPA: hypothetical protein [Caudoviricetes sp.]